MTTKLQSNIAEEINFLHSQAGIAADASKGEAESAIEWAWRCGGKLNEQKATTEHGQWLPWLEENCPTLPHRTAVRYMYHATKYATLADLKAAIKVKSVWALPEPPKPDEGGDGKPPLADRGMTLVNEMASYLREHNPCNGNEVVKRAWVERLEPLAKLYERLREQL